MKPKSLKAILGENLEEKDIPRAFDVIGDIAIIEIAQGMQKHEKTIAATLLEAHKNLKVVCKKAGIHEGVFRTQQLKWLAGEKRKITVHKENGVSLKLDVEQVYFSPRSATERLRIAKQLKANESILVMFAGCGPFPLVFLKAQPLLQKIVAIELNPIAVKYFKENLLLNKSIARTYSKAVSKEDLHEAMKEKVQISEGDVKNIVPSLKEKFDRILMPLPRGGEPFLTTALSAAQPGTILHFYDFLNEVDFEQAEDKVDKACKEVHLGYKKIALVKCGQFGPGIFRICLDVIITKG